MINYILYNADTKTYSFTNLNDDELMALSDKERADYFEQYMLWALSEDQEKLEALCKEAKSRAK